MTLTIVGHAIVSADGMIADRHHRTPPELRNDADWRRFQAALDAAAPIRDMIAAEAGPIDAAQARPEIHGAAH